jgi:hypothetical protein
MVFCKNNTKRNPKHFYYGPRKLNVGPIYTNNPQGKKLRKFKNRTPARFEYIYCTLFPLCHPN